MRLPHELTPRWSGWVAAGCLILAPGCGSGPATETGPEIAKSQTSASQQWQSAKADGSATTKANIVKPGGGGKGGHTLGPGGAN